MVAPKPPNEPIRAFRCPRCKVKLRVVRVKPLTEDKVKRVKRCPKCPYKKLTTES